MKQLIFLILLFTIIFTGCGNETNNKYPTSQWGGDATQKYYDYYEIADGTIVHTSINDEIYNYSALVQGYLGNNGNNISTHTQIINDYNLTNAVLNKNETFNAFKTDYFNTFTNKSMTTINKEYFGLYELTTNYCVINSDLKNCKTYIYLRSE